MRDPFKSLLLVVCSLLAGCSIYAEPQNWNFVQAVGGMAVGQPMLESDEWVLPVKADVSGLHTITVAPTTLNSALVCRSVEVSIEANTVYLTVITSLAGQGRSPKCPSAKLGRPKAGTYAVVYRGPDDEAVRMGEVSISGLDAQQTAAGSSLGRKAQ